MSEYSRSLLKDARRAVWAANGRNHLKELVSLRPDLFADVGVAMDHASMKLLDIHYNYVTKTSIPSAAISLETAALVKVICDRLKPRTILDLGSGFSSIVFGRYAKEYGADVLSVDHHSGWLESTKRALVREQLPNRLVEWSDFQAVGEYDLILNDLGGSNRADSISVIDGLRSAGGLYFIDDLQLTDVRKAIRQLSGPTYGLQRVTADEWGRWLGVRIDEGSI